LLAKLEKEVNIDDEEEGQRPGYLAPMPSLIDSEDRVLISVKPLFLNKADASTQVFLRNPSKIRPLSSLQCEFGDCLNVAIGGTCDYRVCWSKGCQR
jgi:hypothetical protein